MQAHSNVTRDLNQWASEVLDRIRLLAKGVITQERIELIALLVATFGIMGVALYSLINAFHTFMPIEGGVAVVGFLE